MPLYPPSSGSGGGSPSNPGPDANHGLFYNFDMPQASLTVTNLGTTGISGDLALVTNNTINSEFRPADSLPSGAGKNAYFNGGVINQGQVSFPGALGGRTYRPASLTVEYACIWLAPQIGKTGFTANPGAGACFGKNYSPVNAWMFPVMSASLYSVCDPSYGVDSGFMLVGGTPRYIYGSDPTIGGLGFASIQSATPAAKSLLYVVQTYDAATRVANWYMNGSLMQSTIPPAGGIDYNLNNDGDWFIGAPNGQTACPSTFTFRFAVSSIARSQSFVTDVWKNLNGWS